MNTDQYLKEGKVNFLLDLSAGSSGKGKLAAYIAKYANNLDFAVTSASPNASHVSIDGDKQFILKTFPSSAIYHEKLKAIYICAGATIYIDSFWKEIEDLGIPKNKIFIHPRTGVVTQIDIDYEMGKCSLNGEYFEETGDGTIRTGTTASGAGAVRAKKVIRNKTLKVASDYGALSEFVTITEMSILSRINNGETGLFEIGQGFQLSNAHWRFAPYTTSRNVTVSAALDDALLPPSVVGNVFHNNRTFPIRIHSKKYIDPSNGKHLTWDEKLTWDEGGWKYDVIESYSGAGYPDQEEITWEKVMRDANIQISQFVIQTTLTKLPRRIFSFSTTNLSEGVMYNNTGHENWIVMNFANFVDGKLDKEKGQFFSNHSVKMNAWINKYVVPALKELEEKGIKAKLILLGTSEQTDDMLTVEYDSIDQLVNLKTLEETFQSTNNK